MLDIANLALDELDHSGNQDMLAFYDQILELDIEFAEAHILMAETTYGWLNPSDFRVSPPGYTLEQLKTLFGNSAKLAARHAREEPTRLRAEILRANIEVQLDRLVDLTAARLALLPNDNTAWYEHIEALVQTSRFDAASDMATRYFENRPDNTDGATLLLTSIARADFKLGLRLAKELLDRADPMPAVMYQGHRILLYNERVAEARELAERYESLSPSPMLLFLLQLRQACAEGRVEDAERIYDNYVFSAEESAFANTRWLALKTLGRDADARAAVAGLDEPERMYALAGHLTYLHFDPRHFPNLRRVLEQQSAMRDEPVPLNFACKR